MGNLLNPECVSVRGPEDLAGTDGKAVVKKLRGEDMGGYGDEVPYGPSSSAPWNSSQMARKMLEVLL